MTAPPTPTELGHDLLDIPAIHEQYAIPVRTLQRLIYAKHALPVVKLGRRVFVRRADLLAYFDAHRVEAGQ
jgi:hypothetical protein